MLERLPSCQREDSSDSGEGCGRGFAAIPIGGKRLAVPVRCHGELVQAHVFGLELHAASSSVSVQEAGQSAFDLKRAADPAGYDGEIPGRIAEGGACPVDDCGRSMIVGIAVTETRRLRKQLACCLPSRFRPRNAGPL